METKTKEENVNEQQTSSHREERLVVPLQFAFWWKCGWEKYRSRDRWLENLPKEKATFDRRHRVMHERLEKAATRYGRLLRDNWGDGKNILWHNA